jgi:hypothetical protein
MNRLYAFLYDDFLSAPAYQKILANIETRSSVLGIQGRVARLAIFRSARELAETLVSEGAQTIAVVGNDRTLQKIMWFLPDLPVTVGYVPVAEPFGIAAVLGIPFGEAACDVLAARRVETLDVGRIDDRYFLTEVLIRDTKASVNVEDTFRVSASHAGTISVRNLGSVSAKGGASANAKDGWLELAVEPLLPAERRPGRFPFFRPHAGFRRGEQTTLKLKRGVIESAEPADLLIDGQPASGFRFSVGIVSDKFKIITGRGKHLNPVPRPLSASEKGGIFTAAQALAHRAASRLIRRGGMSF